jgi:hypothetical protein
MPRRKTPGPAQLATDHDAELMLGWFLGMRWRRDMKPEDALAMLRGMRTAIRRLDANRAQRLERGVA